MGFANDANHLSFAVVFMKFQINLFLHLFLTQNMELRTDVRHLNNIIKDSGCDSSGKPKLLQLKHVSVQTDEVKDEEFLFAGAGGSGIIRVCILLHGFYTVVSYPCLKLKTS
jgi:hypothetical protein